MERVHKPRRRLGAPLTHSYDVMEWLCSLNPHADSSTRPDGRRPRIMQPDPFVAQQPGAGGLFAIATDTHGIPETRFGGRF